MLLATPNFIALQLQFFQIPAILQTTSAQGAPFHFFLERRQNARLLIIDKKKKTGNVTDYDFGRLVIASSAIIRLLIITPIAVTAATILSTAVVTAAAVVPEFIVVTAFIVATAAE